MGCQGKGIVMPYKDAGQRKLYNQMYRASHHEKLLEHDRKRQVLGDRHLPGSRKKYSDEHREEKKVINRRSYNKNKESVLARSKEWRRNNLEKTKESHKKWRDSEKGKVTLEVEWHTRRTLGKLDCEMVKSIIEETNGMCPYCGNKIEKGSLDHVIPVIKGGTNTKENLVWCCLTCNLSKGSKDLEAWLLNK